MISTDVATPAHQSRAARPFRHDINALRALAVASVVLFHLGVGGVSGGFVGVDVFFVISGFLMTGILVRRADARDLGILAFYRDRVRRIVPALLALCLTLLVIGSAVLDPLTATALARNALAAVLFVSNIPFALEDGYFNPNSDANWLLHSWTLSVEWQFYLLLPLVVALASRSAWIWRHRLPLTLGATALLFLVTAVVSVRSNVTLQLSFFLLPARAWEMLAGACVALAPPMRASATARRAVAWGGVAAIVGSVVAFGPTVPWPSAWTLVPVLGSAAVIWTNAEPSPPVRLAPVQAIGTWSYSIYLWHWPIIVAVRYAGWEMTAAVMLMALAATIAVAALSYYGVETRWRDVIFPWPGRSSRALATGFATWACVALAALLLWQSHGLEGARTAGLPAPVRTALADLMDATADWVGEAPCDATSRFGVGHVCRLGPAGRNDVLVVGDSHALQMIARFGAGQRGARAVTFLYRNGCPPLPSLEVALVGQNCAAYFDQVMAKLKRERFDRIIFTSAWSVYFGSVGEPNPLGFLCLRAQNGVCAHPRTPDDYAGAVTSAFEGLGRLASRLRDAGSEVTILGVDPILDKITAKSLYKETFLAGAVVHAPPIVEAEFKSRHALVEEGVRRAAAIGQARFVDPADSLCRDERCSAYEGDKFIYRDGNHIRASVIGGPRFDYLDDVVTGNGASGVRPNAVR